VRDLRHAQRSQCWITKILYLASPPPKQGRLNQINGTILAINLERASKLKNELSRAHALGLDKSKFSHHLFQSKTKAFYIAQQTYHTNDPNQLRLKAGDVVCGVLKKGEWILVYHEKNHNKYGFVPLSSVYLVK